MNLSRKRFIRIGSFLLGLLAFNLALPSTEVNAITSGTNFNPSFQIDVIDPNGQVVGSGKLTYFLLRFETYTNESQRSYGIIRGVQFNGINIPHPAGLFEIHKDRMTISFNASGEVAAFVESDLATGETYGHASVGSNKYRIKGSRM